MASKIVMLICVLPYALIMYGVQIYEGKENNNLLFGVRLWDGADETRKKNWIKEFRKKLNIVNVLVMLAIIAICLVKRESIAMLLMLTMIIVATFVYFIPFATMNQRLRDVKLTECNEQQRKIVKTDIALATEKEPMPYIKASITGAIVGFIPIVLELITGQNSDIKGSCIMVVTSVSIVGPMLIVLLKSISKNRWMTITSNGEINRQLARVRRYQWGRFTLIAVWTNTIYTVYIWYSMTKNIENTIGIVAVSVIYTMILIVAVMLAEKNIRKVQDKYSKELLNTQEDDSNWIYGMIYSNKEDTRLVVSKRVGIGTTINMAKPAGKLIAIIIMLLLIGSVGAAGVYIAIVDFKEIRLEIEDQEIISRQLGDEYSIKLDDINKVELLEDEPKLNKRIGTSMGCIDKGTFKDENGEICDVLIRKNDGVYLKIETTDGIYYLNDDDKDDTEKIYKYIINYMEDKND